MALYMSPIAVVLFSLQLPHQKQKNNFLSTAFWYTVEFLTLGLHPAPPKLRPAVLHVQFTEYSIKKHSQCSWLFMQTEMKTRPNCKYVPCLKGLNVDGCNLKLVKTIYLSDVIRAMTFLGKLPVLESVSKCSDCRGCTSHFGIQQCEANWWGAYWISLWSVDNTWNATCFNHL